MGALGFCLITTQKDVPLYPINLEIAYGFREIFLLDCDSTFVVHESVVPFDCIEVSDIDGAA